RHGQLDAGLACSFYHQLGGLKLDAERLLTKHMNLALQEVKTDSRMVIRWGADNDSVKLRPPSHGLIGSMMLASGAMRQGACRFFANVCDSHKSGSLAVLKRLNVGLGNRPGPN